MVGREGGASGSEEASHHRDGGRLAGTVVAEEAEELAAVHRQVDSLKNAVEGNGK